VSAQISLVKNTVEVVRVHRGIEYRHFGVNEFAPGAKKRLRDLLVGANSQVALGASSVLDVERPPDPPNGSADILNRPLDAARSNLTGELGVQLAYYFAFNMPKDTVAFPATPAEGRARAPMFWLKPASHATLGEGAFFRSSGFSFNPPIGQIEGDTHYGVNWRIQISDPDFGARRAYVTVPQSRGSGACFDVVAKGAGRQGGGGIGFWNGREVAFEQTSTQGDQGDHSEAQAPVAYRDTFKFTASTTMKQAYDAIIAAGDGDDDVHITARRFFGDEDALLFDASGTTRVFRLTGGTDRIGATERGHIDTHYGGLPSYGPLLAILAGDSAQGKIASARMVTARMTEAVATDLRGKRANPYLSWTNPSPADADPGEWDFDNPAPSNFALEDAGTLTGTAAAHPKLEDEISTVFDIGPIDDGFYRGGRWYDLQLVPSGVISDTNRRLTVHRDFIDEEYSGGFNNTVRRPVRLLRSYPQTVRVVVPVRIAGDDPFVRPTEFGWYEDVGLSVEQPSFLIRPSANLNRYCFDPNGAAISYALGTVPNGWTITIASDNKTLVVSAAPEAGGTIELQITATQAGTNATDVKSFTIVAGSV